jgi:hypothetical protein
MSVVRNFLRRWSTLDINDDNSFLFDENLIGVMAVADEEEAALLTGLSRHSRREDFARRLQQ